MTSKISELLHITIGKIEYFTGFFILKDVNPIFQLIIVPEETTLPNFFKFGI